MKKLSFYFSLLAIAAMAVAATSCTKEEIGSPGTDPGSDPSEQVPDPEGTILISMRNGGDTYLDNNFYIDNADNFSGGYFASLGEMKGLGNVTRIPKHGWANKAAVVPGTGYVAYDYSDGFYRIFVTNYTVNTMNEIIGADVKYQTPFYPTETIKLPLQVLEFGLDGGAQNIVFDNENIIPFKVFSSADWCRVYTSSTLDYSFLTDGIIVEVTPNEGAQREATVSIIDGNNNVLQISIIQAGAEPYLTLSQDTLSLPYKAGAVMSIGVMTNYYFDNLSVTSSANWCQATLELNDGDMLARMNEQLRFKGKERITDKSNYGTSTYTLTVYASSNNNGETPREATVIVASKDGTSNAELRVKQGKSLSLSNILKGKYIATAPSALFPGDSTDETWSATIERDFESDDVIYIQPICEFGGLPGSLISPVAATIDTVSNTIHVQLGQPLYGTDIVLADLNGSTSGNLIADLYIEGTSVRFVFRSGYGVPAPDQPGYWYQALNRPTFVKQ